MRQYLQFRCVQGRKPQAGNAGSFNIVELDKYEEVIMVMGYNASSDPGRPFGLSNGTNTLADRAMFCQFDEGNLGSAVANTAVTVEGTTCANLSTGNSLRVAYLDSRISTGVATSEGEGSPALRTACFGLCFLPNTYDELDPEDNAWSNAVPGDALSEVGEVVRID